MRAGHHVAPCVGMLATQCRVLQQVIGSLRQCLRAALNGHQTCRDHHIAHAGPVLSHNGQTCRLRLQVDQTEGLVHAGPQQYRGRSIFRLQPGRVQQPQKRHPVTKGRGR